MNGRCGCCSGKRRALRLAVAVSGSSKQSSSEEAVRSGQSNLVANQAREPTNMGFQYSNHGCIFIMYLHYLIR